MNKRLPLVATLLLSTALMGRPAMGQTVYKCGTAYSQVPCAGAVTVDANDSRTPAQKAQTDAAAAQATRSADKMEKDRLALEKRQAANQSRTSSQKSQALAAQPPASATKASTKKTGKAPEYFTAAAPLEKAKDNGTGKKSGDKGPAAGSGTAVKQ